MQHISAFFAKHELVEGKVSLTKRLLCDYKEQKAYSYFTSRFIFDISFHAIKDCSIYCFLKSKCQPSQRIKDVPHESWVLIHKYTGEINSAYCSCFAGLGQTCNHIAALLFRLDHAVKNGETQNACTSKPCVWSSSRKTVESIRVRDMEIVKPRAERLNLGTIKRLNTPAKKNFVKHKPSEGMSEACFLASLEGFSPQSVTLAERTPGRRGIHISYDKQLGSETNANLPDSIESIASNCETPDELATKVRSQTYTDDIVSEIERATRDQSSDVWRSQRIGRITASKFHRVYTRMQTLQKNCETDMTAVVSEVMEYATPPSELKTLSYGRRMERQARKCLEAVLKRNGHKNLCVSESGLHVSKTLTYIGASPDGMVSCSCCQKMVLEIKCPTTCMHEVPVAENTECLEQIAGLLKLKRKHKYFTQVLGQMAMANVQMAIFFVYSSRGYHLEVIEFDKVFWNEVLKMLNNFFFTFLVPELVNGNVKKLIGERIAVSHECSATIPMRSSVHKKVIKRQKRPENKVIERPTYLCGVCQQKCEDVANCAASFQTFSIQCDHCKVWYHWSCVGITDEHDSMLANDTYACTLCEIQFSKLL